MGEPPPWGSWRGGGVEGLAFDFGIFHPVRTLVAHSMRCSKPQDLARGHQKGLQGITDDLRDVRARMVDLERVGPGDGGGADEAEGLRRRVDALEVGARAEVSRARDTLIVKGLEEAADETVDTLMRQCQQLLVQLQVTARVTAAQRLGTTGQGRRPRAICMSLATLDDVREVMRNKRKLKDVAAYSSVYIEPSRPAEVRALESNVRRLAKEHPSLEYHRGRLRTRAAAQGNGTTQ